MKRGKGVLLGVLILGILFTSLSFVSAGWWSNLFGGGDDLKGELNTEKNFDVNIQMQNSAPLIKNWDQPLCGVDTCVPTEGSTTPVTFTVYIEDNNGWQDLADGGAVTVQFSKTDEESRPASPTTCVKQAQGTGKILGFDCTINMQYYDQEGDWKITVTATDGTVVASNNGKESDDLDLVNYPYFTYGSLLAVGIKDNTRLDPLEVKLQWDAITPAPTMNTVAKNHIITTNLGNRGITGTGTSFVTVKGADLVGETSGNIDKILASSFAVDDVATPCVLGQVLSASSTINVNGLAIERKGGSRTEVKDLYFCIKGIAGALTTDNYKTGTNKWQINAVE